MSHEISYGVYAISIFAEFKDALVKRLFELGCLGVIDEDERVTAFFPQGVDPGGLRVELDLMHSLLSSAGYPGALSFEHSIIPHADWCEFWKDSFKPMEIGRFTVLPPWEKKSDCRLNIIIDPGMAFGTGQHETTRSCLLLMELYSEAGQKERFLDLGTGTGLLAIAAAGLGYKHVLGIDTDPAAIQAAQKNLELNNCRQVQLKTGDISLACGSYDTIAANLYSQLLVNLSPEIASRLNTGGVAILSGMLCGQEEEVIAAMKQQALTPVDKITDGRWVSLAVKA